MYSGVLEAKITKLDADEKDKKAMLVKALVCTLSLGAMSFNSAIVRPLWTQRWSSMPRQLTCPRPTATPSCTA